jgi:hypothetical protein
MNKIVKYLLIFLFIDLIAVGGYFGYRGLFLNRDDARQTDYEWIVMDESYYPRDYVERFILNEAEAKGYLPVSIKNYGKDKTVLRKFKGRNFAGPKEVELNMMFPGLDDWKLIELKYKDEREREIVRAVLYVCINDNWKVGDSGTVSQ